MMRRSARATRQLLGLPPSPIPWRHELALPRPGAGFPRGLFLVGILAARIAFVVQRQPAPDQLCAEVGAVLQSAASDDAAVAILVDPSAFDQLARNQILQRPRCSTATRSFAPVRRPAGLLPLEGVDAMQPDTLAVEIKRIAIDDRAGEG